MANVRTTEIFTVSATLEDGAAASNGLSLGPLTRQGPSVSLVKTQFKDGQLVVTVGIGVEQAALAFGGSQGSTSQQDSGISITLNGLLGTFDINVDILAALAAITGGGDIGDVFSVPGKFGIQVQSLAAVIPDVFRLDASGIIFNWDPNYDPAENGGARQQILVVTAAQVLFEPFDIRGVIAPSDGSPGLVVYDDGFDIGEAVIIYDPDGGTTSSSTTRGDGSSSGKISIAGILELDDIRIGVSDFSVTFGEDVVIDGTIFVASGGVTFLPGKAINGRITDRASEPPIAPGIQDTEAIRLGLEFENGRVKAFIFDADSLEINLGSFLKLTARDFQINTGAADNEELVAFGAVGAEVTIGSLIIGGEGRNFAFLGDGSFVTKPGFGVFLSLGGADGSSFMWPEWLPIQISEIGIIWPDIELDPTDFKLILSASVTGLQGVGGLEFSGSIRGIVIDIGLLKEGRFPIVGIDEIGVTVRGNLFGGEIEAGLIGGIIKLDAAGQVIETFDNTTTVVDRVFFVGVEGGFAFGGVGGFKIRFAISELGPLGLFLNVDIPIMIVPQITLMMGDFSAGVEFFKTLPDIEDPDELRGSEFDLPTTVSADEWLSQVRQQVVAQYQQIQANPGQNGFAAAFTSPMLITGGAKIWAQAVSKQVFNGEVVIRFSTDGKFLIIGRLNFADDNLSITAKLYANLSKVPDVTVLFLATIPDQARLLSIDGFFKMGFRKNSGAKVLLSTVDAQSTEPYSRLTSSLDGRSVGVSSINSLSYIDVELPQGPDPSDASKTGTLREASVTDNGPEVMLVVNGSGGSTIRLDESQGSTLVNGNRFRIWTKGELKPGDTLDVVFLKGSFIYTSPDGEELPYEGGAYVDPDGVLQNSTPAFTDVSQQVAPYIDVQFVPGIDHEIDFTSLSAHAIRGAVVLNLTRRNGTIDGPIAPDSYLLMGNGKVRYFFNSGFETGHYDVVFVGGQWSDTGGTLNGPGQGGFDVTMPVAEVSGPFNNNNRIVDVNVANAEAGTKFLTVTYKATAGAMLDYGSIMDGDDEFTPTGFALAGSSGSRMPAPVLFELDDMGFGSFVEVTQEAGESDTDYYKRLGELGVTQFRYDIVSDWAPANVTVTFITDSWGDSNGNLEEGTSYDYVVEGPAIRLVAPADEVKVDIGELNARNYVDVRFPTIPTGYTIDPASMADADPEFVLSGPGLGTITLAGGAPWDKFGDGSVWRYWVSGEFADSGDITATFIPGSWSFLDMSTPPAPTTTVLTLDSPSSITVDFDNVPPGYQIDPASITDFAPEFSLDYTGQNFAKDGPGHMALDDLVAPTRIGDGNVYRYTVSGDFAADGTQTVTLVFDVADPWSFTSDADTSGTDTLERAGTATTDAFDNNRTYLDMSVQPSMALSGPPHTVAAPTSGIALTGSAMAGPGIVLDLLNPIPLGGDLYRYIGTGQFEIDLGTHPGEDGKITVTIDPGAATDSAGKSNRRTVETFYVQGPTAALVDPASGGAIGVASINNRGFIDVTFGFLAGTELDLDTVYDLEPEFTIDPATGLELDDSQAPVLVDDDPTDSIYTLRYFTLGTYAGGGITVTLIADSFGFADGTLSTSTDPIVVADPTTANISYIDVAFTPNAGYELDEGSITDPTAEFSFVGDAGHAASGVTFNTEHDPLRLTASSTFRYFLDGDFTAGKVTVAFTEQTFRSTRLVGSTGAVETIDNLASEASFTVQILTADLAQPMAGDTEDAALLNNRGFIDVTFTLPDYADGIDIDTVTDLDPEFDATVTEGTFELDASQAPVFIGDEAADDYTFRYWYVGTFIGDHDGTAGDNVTITFIGNSFDYLDAGGERIPNFADQVAVVQEDSEGLYILVDFGESLLLDEPTVDASDIVVHTAAVSLSNGSERGPPDLFRFDVTGAAVGDEISIGFMDAAWTYGGDNARVEAPVSLHILETVTYIDIRFNTAGGIAIDETTINGDEISLAGPGLGTATLADGVTKAPTLLGDNIYRCYIDRGEATDTGFAPGAVLLSFHGANWADELGNMGQDETESFVLIEVLEPPPAGAEAATGDIFFIDIGGRIRLEAPFLGFDEPIIEMRARVTLEFGEYEVADGSGGTITVNRFSLDASGTIKIIKLGNIGSAAARFIFQTVEDENGDRMEFWGVLKIQANLDFLKNYGIFIEASALLQINLTRTTQTERISLEGIAGDVLVEGLISDTSGVSTSVLGEVDLASLPAWESAIGGVDVDPSVPGDQLIRTADAIVQTVIVGQKWRIITFDDEGKRGPVYFVTINDEGGYDLRTEYQTFVLEPEMFAIELVGSIKIKENGSSDPSADDWVDLFGGFYLKITPQRFELLVISAVRINPLGISGTAIGLVIIDASLEGPGIPGIALMLSVQLSVGAPPESGDDDSASVSNLDGIFRLEGQVVVTLNTTLREQTLNVPTSFDDLMPADIPRVFTIHDSAPNPDGSDAGGTPAIYVAASIQGSITLFDTLTMSGFIGFTASVDITGNVFVRITAAVSTSIDFLGAMSGSLDLLFYTNLNGMGPGIIGRVQLALADAGNIPGVEIEGQFLVEINSYLSDQTIRTFQTNLEADPGYTGAQPNILATDPDTGLFVFGDVTIASGLRIVLQGKLILGPVVQIEGRFEFSISPTHLEIAAFARMKMIGFGEFEINGAMRVDNTGFALYIDVSIGSGFGGGIGLSFSVEATLQIYIGSLNEKTLNLADGSSVVVKRGFKLRLAGEVTFLGFATASGSTTITLQAGVFSVEFDVSLNLGPLTVAARGGAAIYTDSNPGLALLLDVEVNANIFEVIKIKASGKLQLNTSSAARTLAGVTMNPNSFLLALLGEVKFLEVLKFQAGFLLEVGYEGVGSWRVEFGASMDFFGLVTLKAKGMFNYKGYFDISLDGELVLGTRSFGLVANFHFRVAFGEREVAGTPGLTEFFFLVEFSGGAKLRAFGITFAGVNISAKLEAAGEGRVPVKVSAKASVKILFVKIKVSMSFTLGYIELPKKVYLAGNPTGDARIWNPQTASGVLYLNMGSRNSIRNIGEGATDELYVIEHLGSDTKGEIIRVVFSGRETIYKGVKKVVAFGDAGDDHIYVKEGVTSDIEFHGGAGNDVFIYEGTGRAWLYGDGGDDYMQTGADSTTVFLYGGSGIDYIIHNGTGRAEIDGGPDSDKIFGGEANDLIHGGAGDDDIDGRGGVDQMFGDGGNDLIHWDVADVVLGTVDGGAGRDMLEVIGTKNNDRFTIGTPAPHKVSVATADGAITGTRFEHVMVDARGGSDTISVDFLGGSDVDMLTLSAGRQVVVQGTETVNDEATGQPIEQTRVLISDDRSADTITLFGSDSAVDVITLTDYESEGVTGINVAFAGAGNPGALDIVVIDSIRNEGDELIIDAQGGGTDSLGGGDEINAEALTADRAALTLIGGTGGDTVFGSPFNDVIDSGLGNDRVRGGLGFDQFFDASPSATNNIDDDGDGRIDEADEDEFDILDEVFDQDVGLYNDKLVVGVLQNSAGTGNFEVGKDAANELLDAGDRFAAGAVVENLKGQFERAEIKGGAGNNTFVVNDLNREIRGGGERLPVVNWRGEVRLDNLANDGLYAEHYLVHVPADSHATVDIFDTSGDANDRLVITGTDQGDRFQLTKSGSGAAETGTVQALFSSAMTVRHNKIENVELRTIGGNDRIAIRGTHTINRVYAGVGDDTINVGSHATIGNFGEPDTNSGGTLNRISALLEVHAQNTAGTDVMTLDDTADGRNNYGTLTSNRVTNGVRGSSGVHLMGAAGSITYTGLEVLNIHLGDALSNGNVFSIESTHGEGSVTRLTTGDGPDVINVETIAGDTTIDGEDGSDIVRIGSTAARVGQINGVLDAFGSTANEIEGRLTISGKEGGVDTLNVYDLGDDQKEAGELKRDEITGMGMTLGIGYTGFELLQIWLSDNDNTFYIDSTHTGVTVIDAGDETPQVNRFNDQININSTSGPTTISMGNGNDVVRVNYDRNNVQTFVSGIDGVLTLHGEQGSDRYLIGLAGQISSRINVFDQSRGDPGIDRLQIFGTNEIDYFLFRANKQIQQGMVAAIEVDENREPVEGGVIERINYDADISGAIEVFGRDGDDTFVFDDNLAPTVVRGDAGNDTFQFGQVFQSFRDERNPDNGLAEEDYFETTQITRGFLSNGISQSSIAFGGTGNDNFTVYRNLAELFLFGDEDDDTFTVRAFVKVDPNDPKAPYTNINGGQGADFVAFTVNAPVRIEGGDGFDTLTVIGTEFGDDFVVNEQGVFGAGLFITYTGLERVVVDALEGNDRFFIESTSEDVAIEIVGGVGSDTFNVGGSDGKPVTVVSNNLEGHSGLVIQEVDSDDPDYQSIFVRDISADVADNDEAGVVVTLDVGSIRVFEEAEVGGLTVNAYRIVLSRVPEESVQITAATVGLSERAVAAGAEGLKLNTANDPATASKDGVTLNFTRSNWFRPQTIYVFAENDDVAEGTNGFNIIHRTQEGSSPKDGGAYDGLAVLGVVALVVDDDAQSMLVAPYAAPTVDTDTAEDSGGLVFYDPTVGEGVGTPGFLETDEYWLRLTRAPTGDVRVDIEVNVDGAAAQTRIVSVDSAQVGALTTTVTFTSLDWHVPRKIVVEAIEDSAKEATHYSRISHEIRDANLDYFLGITDGIVAQGMANAINGDIDNSFRAEASGSQIEIQGPAFDYDLTTPYTDVTVTFGGDPLEGESWTLRVNGTPYVYTIQLHDGLADVATGLGALVASSEPDLVVTTAGIVDGLRIRDTTEAITVSFAVSGESNGYAVLSAGTPIDFTEDASSEHAWEEATIEILDDSPEAPIGAVWTVSLNGIEFEYVRQADETTPTDPEDIQFVVAGLADAINLSDAGFVAKYTEATIEFTGIPAAGETWTLFLDGAIVESTPGSGFSYEVPGGDLTLESIVTGLAALLADPAYAAFTVTPNGREITIERGDGGAFTIAMNVDGVNLQSAAAITGLVDPTSPRLVVLAEDGAPFTVAVTRADSASQVEDFDVGDQVIAGDSVASSTFWSKLILNLNPTTPPINDGASWRLILGVDEAQETELRLTGQPADTETYRVRLTQNSFSRVFSYTVDADDEIADVVTALAAAMNGGVYSAVADGSAGTLRVASLGAFEIELEILPAAGETQTDVAVESTLFDRSTTQNHNVAYNYVTGANREVKMPESQDVTVVDDDAPGVLVIQTRESTDVIEPTEVIRLGGGTLSQVSATTRFRLASPVVEAGQTWTVYLAREHHVSGPPPSISITTTGSDTLTSIALKLENAIDMASGEISNYEAIASGEFLRIRYNAGLSFGVFLQINGPTFDGVIFIGDFGTSVVEEVTGVHDSVFTAQDLDTAKWSTNAVTDITRSTTVPHISVLGSGDGSADVYAFEITEEMLAAAGAGIRVIVDINHGFDRSDPIFWVSKLTLFELREPLDPELPTLPNVIAEGSSFNFPDPGSTWYVDARLETVIEEEGVYYIEVSALYPAGDGLPEGIDYELHVSVEHHDEASFLFAPEPLAENEFTNNGLSVAGAQDLDGLVSDTDADRGVNFFTFYDPEVGNGHLTGPAVPVDSTTPYVRIIGEGNGSADVYSFNVNPVPTGIELEAADTTSTGIFDRTGNDSTNTTQNLRDNSTYYERVVLKLSGKVKEGDIWRLGVGYRDFQTAPASAGDSLRDIAEDLEFLMEQAQLAGYIHGYDVDVSGSASAPTLTISNPDGFVLQGRPEAGGGPDKLEHTVADAGTVKRTTSAQTNAGVAVQFDSASVLLSSTGTFNSEDVWVLTVNGIPTTGVTGSSASVVAGALASAWSGSGISVSQVGSTAELTITDTTPSGTSPFTVAVSIEGDDPRGYATISGTPTGQPTMPIEVVKWSSAVIQLPADTATSGRQPYENEGWTLTVGGTPFTHVVTRTDTFDTIGAALAGAFADVSYSNATNRLSYTGGGEVIELSVTQAAPNAASTLADDSAAIRVLDASGFTTTALGTEWVLTLPGAGSRTEPYAGSRSLTLDEFVQWVNGTTLYSATRVGNRLIIVRADGTAFAPTLVENGGVAFASLSDTTSPYAVVFDLSTIGTAAQAWVVTVSGGPTWRVDVGGTVNATASALAGLIHAASGWTTSWDNTDDELTITRTSAISSITLSENALTATAALDTTYSVIEITATGPVAEAETWGFSLGGTDYTRETPVNTFTGINSLLNLLAGHSGFNGAGEPGAFVDFVGGQYRLFVFDDAALGTYSDLGIQTRPVEGRATISGMLAPNWKMIITPDLTGYPDPFNDGDTWSLRLNSALLSDIIDTASDSSVAQVIVDLLTGQSGIGTVSPGPGGTVEVTAAASDTDGVVNLGQLEWVRVTPYLSPAVGDWVEGPTGALHYT